jgi:hypothetical protein
MHRKPHQETARTPFIDERLDGPETRRDVFGFDDRERMGDAHRRVADSDADALLAEIESKDGRQA